VADPAALLACRQLAVRYRGAARDAVHDITLALRRGERVALLGPSGSGKSTLALALAGAIPDLITAELRGTLSRAADVACVQQDVDAQLVAFTVEDELAFALENRGLPPPEIDRRIGAVLTTLLLRGLHRDRQTLHLSAGWRQRVALGAALAEQAALLVIDEPTAHLEESGAAAAMDAVTAAADAAVLMVEHRADLAAACADRLFVLDRSGALVAEGAPHDVLAACGNRAALGLRLPPLLRAAQAAGLRALPRDAAALLQLPAADRAAAIAAIAPRPANIAGAPLIVIRGAGLRRAGASVLRDIDLTLARGEVLGLAGPNGAGKTSLALLAAGALRTTEGTMLRHASAPPVMVPQNPALVLAGATLALEAARRRLPWPRAAAALESFGLDPQPEAHPLLHSLGEMRRIALALAFAHDAPGLVILDEPTAGLDALGLAALERTVADAARRGCAVLLISHDLDTLGCVCGRIAILDGGRIAALGPADDICFRAAGGHLAVAPPPAARLARALGWRVAA
jgi:energy-coupling factor transport system ATP-binding protein